MATRNPGSHQLYRLVVDPCLSHYIYIHGFLIFIHPGVTCGCFSPAFWTINNSKIVTTSSFRVPFSLDSWFVGFSFAVHFFAHTFRKRRRFLLKSSDWSRKLGFACIRCLQKVTQTYSPKWCFFIVIHHGTVREKSQKKQVKDIWSRYFFHVPNHQFWRRSIREKSPREIQHRYKTRVDWKRQILLQKIFRIHSSNYRVFFIPLFSSTPQKI